MAEGAALAGAVAAVARTILRIFFRRIVIDGRENLPAKGPAVFVPNHPNSLIDPLFVFFFTPPFELRFVAKEPLFRLPVLGGILRRIGAIPVVRRMDNPSEPPDYGLFFEACMKALAAGHALTLFPEGRSAAEPSLSPMKTGPARLLFMARERGLDTRLIPLGLNYESPSTFRTAVHVSIGRSIGTSASEELYRTQPVEAVRELTETIGTRLAEVVFQASSERDRSLMLLLERLYATDEATDSWSSRLKRLRAFEQGLKRLRAACPEEIEHLRILLERYASLAERLGLEPGAPRQQSRTRSLGTAALSALGWLLALPGVLLNSVPWRLCGLLVRRKAQDITSVATWKVTYGLLVYPLSWLAEALLLGLWLGPAASLVFAVGVAPLSFFTLRFLEWQEGSAAEFEALTWSSGGGWLLARQRERILVEVDRLAAHPLLSARDGAP